MNISAILGHPSQSSFNHAIAETVVQTLSKNGHAVCYHDLYAEEFNPVIPEQEIPKGADLNTVIQRHCDELSQADGIIIVHPNWWGQPPAILKGWIDRVIRPGIAYEFQGEDEGDGVPVGLLKAQAALVFNTSNTYPEREKKIFGDPLETLWKNCVFSLCGVNTFYRQSFSVIVVSSETQRKQWLEEVQETVHRFFPENSQTK